MEVELSDIMENEKNKILESMELSKKEHMILLKIYDGLIQKYKENKRDDEIKKNIFTLQKYIFS